MNSLHQIAQDVKQEARSKTGDVYLLFNDCFVGATLDIKRITNQFTDKLGEAAYGTDYKGKLSSEIFVAVKALNGSNGKGEEFINEVGTMGLSTMSTWFAWLASVRMDLEELLFMSSSPMVQCKFTFHQWATRMGSSVGISCKILS
ncbi:PREDICTED: rust resistance kinase Lr10 [Prunus dulcis]|uniref:PREDICTED: rust resistance kinase Lr10 n=1 Tax=Prunus dulcis TaxID=3755 RepID=A0A5E4GK30_PRUDU|nr:PREDICTED: rust resistance kinase Lr10 [Prunus dulcis]